MLMKHPPFSPLAVLALAASAGLLQAGTYNQNFDAFAAGTTNLGDGSYVNSSPLNVNACSVQGQRMRLSNNSVTSTYSIYRLPEIDPGYEVNSFDVQFDMYLTSGSPADGMSLNFGGLPLADTAGPGEEGYQLPGGLVVSFDTYINNPPETARSIDVRVDGVQVATLPESSFGNFDLTGAQRHVTVHWDSAGLDVVWRNVASGVDYIICNNLAVPGLLPNAGDRFVFSARTGGLAETLDIDNLVISTTTLPPISTPDVVFSEMVLDNTDREDEHCNTPGWVEIYNGTSTAKDLSTYSLTDTAATPGKWTFPAGTTLGPYQYRAIFFGYDGTHPNPDTQLHASFAPPVTGGYLGLYNNGVLVDSWNPYPAQAEDISYGYIGQARTLGFLETPTFGTKNGGIQSGGPPVSEEVAWPRDGGLITDSITITLPAPATAGGEIRYTTDNSAPTQASTLYTAPINVSTSTNLRARIFAPGRLPGAVSSRTFLKLGSTITNYRGTGQPFSSNLPVIVIDGFGRNLDSENSVTPGARPYRYTYAVVLDKDPANSNRAIVRETKHDDATDAGAGATRSPVNFQGRGGMHVRGESSAGMPQRQYSWETWDNEGNDKDVPILGMPEDSDWVLYAPATDKTLLRNFIVYNSMFLLNGQGSAVRTRLVEVFFNQPYTDSNPEITYNDYRGVYVLMERIKRGNDRVDIAKLDPCDTSPSLISGGYIFKKDKASADPDFTTTNGQLLQIVEPETTVNDPQWTWLRDHVNQFEASLYSSNFSHLTVGYRAFIDERSFQDNELWVEMFKQIDGYRLSTYFNKDRGGKIKSAPLWDYNLSCGNADYLAGWDYRGWYRDAGISQGQSGNTDFQYYWRLRQDPYYITRLWDRYWTIRKGVMATSALMARIDAAVADVTNSQPTTDITNGTGTWPSSTPTTESPAARHHARWQRLGFYDWPNAPGYGGRVKYKSSTDATDYANVTTTPYTVGAPPAMSESTHMKAYLTNRMAWMDDAYFAGTTNTILRPPVFSQNGGNVSAPYNLTITGYTGTPPAASFYGKAGTLNYATGPIYYTTDGTDPILPAQPATPGTPRPYVVDGNACEVVIPTSDTNTGGGIDAQSPARNWKDWDFNSGNLAAGSPAWKSGLNGVGYDNNLSVSYFPFINIYMGATPTAGGTPVPPVIYGSNMINVNQTCWIRLPFTLTADQITGATNLRLYGRVDDGFVAYVNGVRIADSNAPATLVYNSGATALQPGSDNDGLIYKEFPTTNIAAALAALRVGSNVLAIHGMNSGVGSSDFLMRFKLDGESGGLPATPGGPSATAQLYSGPVVINSGVTIRARQVDTASGAATPMTEGTFVVDTVPASASNIVVSEIMYNPSPPTAGEVTAGFDNDNMFEYLEIQNISSQSVDMSGVTFSNVFQFTWPTADPNLRVLPPGGRAVVVGNTGAFAFRYNPGAGVKVAGLFDGNLGNGGERIVINGTGGVIKDFTYDDESPWPMEPDGTGFSLVLNNPAVNPDHNLAVNWRSSFEANGTPGGAAGSQPPPNPGNDTDGDGMSDLMEFAMGTLGTSGSSQNWPATGHIEYAPTGGTAQDHLTFSYTRSRNADGFSTDPQVSTALSGWQPISTMFTLLSQTNNGDGTATITWRSTAPASSLAGRLFLRLSVSLNP